MLFNSLQFLIFLPIVIILYYSTPFKYRWILLLAASYYFYMCWRVNYIFLILFSTLIDYFCARQIEKKKEKRKKRIFLIISLLTNLGLLGTFKYVNHLLNHFNIMHQIPALEVLLPVGISFYTFQTLSYTIDVYFGKVKAEKHLGYFALYVSYFPQLVAGPIERFDRLTPQLKEKHDFNYENLINGVRLILYGLFIKMVIADNLSVYVDQIYKMPDTFNSLSILTGIIFYSFQIYSDFYGYSTIAVGTALIMGVNIMDNFKAPYLARSVKEFWQRWHISLSTWFQSYLYFPLGGNRVSKIRWIFNIIVVFMVSGLWHGANWTFIIWGTLWGILYLAESGFNRLFGLTKTSADFSLRHFFTAFKMFLIATVAWIFFRSQSFSGAINIFKDLVSNVHTGNTMQVERKVWWLLLFFVVTDIFLFNSRFDKWCSKQHFTIRWFFYAVLIFSVIVFSGVEDFPFIYFQF